MRLFTTVKEIKSREGVMHFRRYAIIECKWFNIYIHRVYKADEEEHLHDHPWDYTSLVMRGGFLEGFYTKDREFALMALKPGSVSRQKAERVHKIYYLVTPMVKTLFFTGPRRREWGYDVNGKWVDNVTYRKMKWTGKL